MPVDWGGPPQLRHTDDGCVRQLATEHEEVPMPSIVGGFDIHRKQLTFDYLDTVAGEVRRGQITPADRGTCAAGWPSWRTHKTPRSPPRRVPGGGM